MAQSILETSAGLYRPEGTRILYLNGGITEDMAFLFNLNMLQLESEDSHQDITVYINSPGGSVSAGLSMIDTMDIVSCDVKTVCIGIAASMAAWILMCGTKGKRFALPHSNMMLHQPLGGMGGIIQASDIKLMSDEMMRTKAELFAMVTERTGQPLKEVERDCDRDFYLSAPQAIEYGLIDGILKSHKNARKS